MKTRNGVFREEEWWIWAKADSSYILTSITQECRVSSDRNMGPMWGDELREEQGKKGKKEMRKERENQEGDANGERGTTNQNLHALRERGKKNGKARQERD